MQTNRRPDRSSTHRLAAVAATLLLVVTAAFSSQAQIPPFPTPLPMCYAPPSPGTDGWPIAVGDDLGSTPAMPVTFSAASLVSNDTGTSLAVTSVDASGSNGGVITGTDPFTYSPPIPFLGTETFSYEITDAAGQTAIGVVVVTTTADTVDPSVSITAPIGITVGGSVTVRASASDNVGVTSVTFFDAASQIGSPDIAAPFETIWNTTLVGNGNHTLVAVARDAAGNIATSAPVAVDVSNLIMVTVPGVVGQTQGAAGTAITGAGLTVGAISFANSATVAGLVISQSPSAGGSVESGSAVAFTVSLGPALVAVPNVVTPTLTQAAATTAITNAALVVGTVTNAASATVASGSVISSSPVAGTLVPVGNVVSLVVSTGSAVPLAIAQSVGVNKQSNGSAVIQTGLTAITPAANTLIVAFVAADGPPAPAANTTANVTNTGTALVWTLRGRSNTQRGTAEVWSAFTTPAHAAMRVKATLNNTSSAAMLQVVTFTGATSSLVGAVQLANAATGSPTASLVTTGANSLVYAVGVDWDNGRTMIMPAGRTSVRQFIPAVNDTYWVQQTTAAVPAIGTTVPMSVTYAGANTDRWNLALIEIRKP